MKGNPKSGERGTPWLACGRVDGNWRTTVRSLSHHEHQDPSFSSTPLNSSQELKRTETLVELDPSLWIVCWLTRLVESTREPRPAPKRATSLGTAGPRPPGSHAPKSRGQIDAITINICSPSLVSCLLCRYT